ncbi:flavin oxidoreductase [Mycobacteroides sp. LB1]|nr:flavin oxidoreductase [Mycobacteroides sp. LB1]
MSRDPWCPITLNSGGVLRNRFILAPMTTNASDPDGQASESELGYLARRAATGFGAVVTSCAYVHPDGRSWHGIGAVDDRHLTSLSAVADAARGTDGTGILQIYDGGRIALPELAGPQGIRAPSAIPSARPNAQTPRELSDAEVRELIAAFGTSAGLGIRAGFDGVEIHGANHYLVHQFFSPRANQRDDEWGGDLDRRMQFPLQVAREVRAAVGPGVIIGFRLTPFESEAGGYTLDESTCLADRLADEGIDYIHISMDDFRRNSPQPEDRDWTKTRERVESRNPIAAISAVVEGRCAVVASGGIRTMDDTRDAITAGADLLAIGRAALIDPEWVDKMKLGAQQDIRTQLPDDKAEIESHLTIPARMVRYLLSRPGWIPRAAPDGSK